MLDWRYVKSEPCSNIGSPINQKQLYFSLNLQFVLMFLRNKTIEFLEKVLDQQF